jgi:hypothetical protein
MASIKTRSTADALAYPNSRRVKSMSASRQALDPPLETFSINSSIAEVVARHASGMESGDSATAARIFLAARDETLPSVRSARFLNLLIVAVVVAVWDFEV